MNEQDKMLRRIQGLMDKAHGGTTDAEAAALLAKADELMVKYSISQFEILDPNRRTTARGVVQEDPEVRTIMFMESMGDMDFHLQSALRRVFGFCAEHLFVRIGAVGTNDAKVVGYPVDLRFLEMFFLKLKLQMFSEMLVKVDPEGDWVAQIAGLKNMGYKWEQIHYKMQLHPDYPGLDQPWSRSVGSKFIGKVKRYYEDNDIPRNTSSNPRAWREDFVDGYVYRIQGRLRDMRAATVNDNPNLPELFGQKKSLVEEALWANFPKLAPHPKTCECDSCHYRKCENRSTCSRSICVAMRKPIRASSTRYRNLNTDAAAAGRKAAERADLTDKGPIG